MGRGPKLKKTISDFLSSVIIAFFRGRITSVSRALVCRAEVVGSIPRTGPILRVLK